MVRCGDVNLVCMLAPSTRDPRLFRAPNILERQCDGMSSIQGQAGRFAPSTTGPAHPGTLLAGLLCWLDIRSRGGRLVLRLEDLDPERCTPEWAQRMREDLLWLGLDWDEERMQSQAGDSHRDALDRLAAAGVLYPCSCSRTEIRERGEPAPDGGWRYPNTCRERSLPAGGWRESREPLRVRLPEGVVTPPDEGGIDLAQDPAAALGDPVVRRRDGAAAYHLASVVDDATSRVTRVVRGRDLASTTATQVALRLLLDLSVPVYRHHLLLLEQRGGKLAKLHGAVGATELRRSYRAESLCGWLATAAGLLPEPRPLAPGDLLPLFSWERVATRDRVASWNGETLDLLDAPATPADASPP
jgi:glutamyl/glutaminyl-tRNA synthetase